MKRVLTEACGLLVEDGTPQPLLIAPLIIRRQACGVIYLEGAAFRETDLQLLVAIAQLASMAMENAFQLEWLETENERLEAELHPDDHMIGDSAPLQDLQRDIARAAQTNATVLILEKPARARSWLRAPSTRAASAPATCSWLSIARRFQKRSSRASCSATKKGPLPGPSLRRRAGWNSRRGTVSLDEIGEIPLQLQVKLLRVLQERQVERVGGTHPVKLDIRLIAATNRNLEEEVRAGRFRQDLYYRLNVVALKTPALRDRRCDILPLAMHFASKFGQQCGRRITGIAPEVQPYLLRYPWPGNIRELENAIERAVVLGAGDMIELDHLPEAIREIPDMAGATPATSLQGAIDESKRQAIARAFERAGSDHSAAAKLLGVHPNYLCRLTRT